MCSFSCQSISWSEQTVQALYKRVLNTLYLAVMLWWLSQLRYWSVCVGFLYTDVMREPLDPMEIDYLRKGCLWPQQHHGSFHKIGQYLYCG